MERHCPGAGGTHAAFSLLYLSIVMMNASRNANYPGVATDGAAPFSFRRLVGCHICLWTIRTDVAECPLYLHLETTPASTFDVDVPTGDESQKRAAVPGYDPSPYTTESLWRPLAMQTPRSIAYRKGLFRRRLGPLYRRLRLIG